MALKSVGSRNHATGVDTTSLIPERTMPRQLMLDRVQALAADVFQVPEANLGPASSPTPLQHGIRFII